MQHVDIVTLGLLLFIACLVAIVTRRIGLPYAIGLVVAGIGLSLVGYRSRIELTPELIFTVLLPPLIFEAALHLGWQQFRREAPLVLGMAFVGTLLSALVVAGGMHWLVQWGWQASLLFGSLIAATDPVSVIAMMKEQKAEQRFRFLMEAEGIVNDGAAAVLFALVVAWIGGADSSATGAALSLLTTAGGGVLCGLVVAGALLTVAGRSDDHLVEIADDARRLRLVPDRREAPRLGRAASLAAGMLVGNWGKGRRLTEYGGEALSASGISPPSSPTRWCSC